MSFARPADEYALQRMKRARATEHGVDYDAMQQALKKQQAELDKSEAEFLARKQNAANNRSAKIQNIKSTAARIEGEAASLAVQRDADQQRADTAWLLNKYIDLHPDAKQTLENYIPTATKQEMEATQKAKDYKAGWYTNGRVENDAEAWMRDHDLIKGGLGYNLQHAWRFVWSGEEKLEQARKVATTYTNSAYTGMDAGARAAAVRDKSFVSTLWDSVTGQKANAGEGGTLGPDSNSGPGFGLGVFGTNGDLNPKKVVEQSAGTVWEWLKTGIAQIPVWVDVALVMGGVALTYFGVVEQSAGVLVPGMLTLGLGLFMTYCWFQYKTPNATTQPTTSFKGPDTRKRDAMGNDQKLIPDSKH